jgi:DNA modification methylase
MFFDNVIYNEDCLTGMARLPDKSVDLIVTDPPYEMRNHGGGFVKGSHRKAFDEIGAKGLTAGFDPAVFNEMARVMKALNLYIWCAARQIPVCVAFFAGKLGCALDILIWQKTNPMPLFNNKWLTDKEYCLYFRKGGYCAPQSYDAAKTVFRQPANTKDKKLWKHPTIKPLNIIEAIIQNSSKPGDVVLDPFIGSGTTAVAALLNGRRYIGFELDGGYFETAKRRVMEARRQILLRRGETQNG